MADFYSDMQDVASSVLAEFKQGNITLTRDAPGAVDPAHPWIPGEGAVTEYMLDATASGVGDKYVDGTLIKSTDLMILASVKATAAGVLVPLLKPIMSDTLKIDGIPHNIKQIQQLPEAGVPVAFRIFVSG